MTDPVGEKGRQFWYTEVEKGVEMAEIDKRKEDHIRINLEENVRSGIVTGFDDFRFVNSALPEIDLGAVDCRCEFLGKKMDHPILISSMTGGTENGDRINRILAEAANGKKVAMAVGSQRAALEKGNLVKYEILRRTAPNIPLYANLGAVQLNYGFSVNDCRRIVDSLQADALILHLNPLQEALQENGQTNFKDLLKKIEQVCHQFERPVIIKEVGWGISVQVARQLIEVGASAIDVAGAGGTSWSEVEKYRATSDMIFKIAGDFLYWGIPTAYAVQAIHEELSQAPLISSGGLRNGIDLAKSIALGASLGGFAGKFLRAATISTEAVNQLIDEISLELHIAMFACGAANMDSLANSQLIRYRSFDNG
jgi:isopentenyl-diphosphate Delta-isomerase